MVVVEDLPPEFEVELAAELAYSLLDVLCLELDVLVVVESDSRHACSFSSGVCNSFPIIAICLFPLGEISQVAEKCR